MVICGLTGENRILNGWITCSLKRYCAPKYVFCLYCNNYLILIHLSCYRSCTDLFACKRQEPEVCLARRDLALLKQSAGWDLSAEASYRYLVGIIRGERQWIRVTSSTHLRRFAIGFSPYKLFIASLSPLP